MALFSISNLDVEGNISEFVAGDGIGTASRAAPSDSAVAQWRSDSIADFTESADFLAVGDFIGTTSGTEIVAVTTDSSAGTTVFNQVTLDSDGDWSTKQVFQADSAAVDISWGAVIGSDALNELAFISTEGSGDSATAKLTMLQPDQGGSAWQGSVIANFGTAVTAVAVGDIVHTNSGMEIVTADIGNKIHISYITSEGTWNTSEVDSVTANIVDIIITDTDTGTTGNQLLIIDDAGNLIEKSDIKIGENTLWSSNTLWTEGSGSELTAVTVGDADNDGKTEILVGTSNNKLMMLDKSGDGSWIPKEIFTDKAPIRSVAVVDMDPFLDGFETVCAGDSKMLTLLNHKVGTWSSRVLHEDTEMIVDLYAGSVDSSNVAGQEVVMVNGAGGNVIKAEFTGFYSETLWTADNKLSGVAIGDLDPDHEGNEAMVVGMNKDNVGILSMAWREGSSWSSEVLFEGYGELLTPVIGDFDNQDGNELAFVGMYSGPEGVGVGQATIVKKVSGMWETTDPPIFMNPKMLHGAAVGEFDTNRAGDELVVTGFAFNVTLLEEEPDSPGTWNSTHIWHGQGKVRKAVIADVDATHPGDELYVVDKSGNLTMLYQDGSGWHWETLWTDPGTPGLARIAIGDADNDGKNEIIVGGDSNNVGLIEQSDSGNWLGKVIWTDINKIRGVAIGDFSDENPGNEVAVYGYSMRVSMLTPNPSGGQKWNAETIFTDIGRGHDLAVGEFDSMHDGAELLLSGYSRNLTMVGFYGDIEPAGFTLSASKTTLSAERGKNAVFNLTVGSTGNFNGPVYLDISSLPAGLELMDFQAQVPGGSGSLQLTLKPTGSFSGTNADITVNAYGAGEMKSVNLALTVTGESTSFGVASVKPEKDSHDVDIEHLKIEITFNQEIDFETVDSESIVITAEGGELFKGTIELSDDKKILSISEIQSDDDKHEELPADTKITITVKQTLMDIGGNSLGADYSWEFTTAGAHDEDDGTEFEGMMISIIIIVVIIIIIAIVGIVSGRKKSGEEKDSESKSEDKKEKD
jgi:hypothetical protein